MRNFTYTPVRHSVFSIFLFLLCCISGSLLSIPTAYAQLSGTYTIGGSGGNYATIHEALTALEEEGISAAVTFQIQGGKYEEQLLISSIPGSSCSSLVTFEGAGRAPEEVLLQAPSASDFAVQLKGVDGIVFRNLSIVGDIDVFPGTDCFQLENNIIRGTVVAKSSATERSNEHLYRNNHFQAGGKIIKENEAPWNPDAPVFDQGLVIEGNVLSGGGITLTGQEDFAISQNSVNVSSQEGNGLTVTNSWYGQEISGNSIGASADNYKGKAMVLNSGAAARITGNNIGFGDGGFGMDISAGKSLGNEILIANNLLLIDGLDARGHSHYDPISNLVGMDMTSAYGNEIKIYHNSVNVIGQSENVPNYALSIQGEANSFHIVNNLFANSAFGGTGIIVEDPSVIAVMDYNNLYFEFTSLFASWEGEEVDSLEEWQNVTGFGENSISANPEFPFNVPVEEMIGAGIYLEEVPEDRYGQERNDPPTIGAVEKELIRTPLSGIFTIGGDDPDFASFAEAFDSISSAGGIEDSITFRVRPGVYSEQINVSNYVQAPKVTIEGESGDSTDVILQYPEENVLDPEGEVLVLNGTRNFTLRNVTVASGILINGGSDLLFESNIIREGVNASEARQDTYRHNLFQGQGITIRGPGHVDQGGNHRFLTNLGLVIQGNTFTVSSSAIDLFAEEEVIISDNTISIEQPEEEGGITAIRVDQSLNIKEINNNSITSKHSGTTGISLTGSFFAGGIPQELSRNKIILTEGGTGISIHYDPGASSLAGALVANNMLSINATNGATGIAVDSPPADINFFHNSIHLYGSSTNSQAIALVVEAEDPANVLFNNNIFANFAEGYVVRATFSDGEQGAVSSDFNDLFTTGEVLALWEESTATTLEEWQLLTGFDPHSLAVDPEFISPDDLIPANPALDGAGTGLDEVQEDYFGVQRMDPPTIGAVEEIQANQSPVVSAGEDKAITLPQESLQLGGTGRDPDGVFRAFLWEKVSGPEVSMLNANTANLLLEDLVAGEYVFRFTATDNEGASSSDEMKLTVKAGNQPPMVNAGPDKRVVLPVEKLILSGTGRDPDGVFRAFRWEKVSGPSVSMQQANTANLVLTALVEGTYVFRFLATDNGGATAQDEMRLTVEELNQPPVVSAGGDKTITLPRESLKLSGTGRDPDGVFRAFRWQKVSGPSVDMQQANTANLILEDLVAGTYLFRFTGTDNRGASASDEMTLTVQAEPVFASQPTSIRVSAYPNTFRDHINIAVEGGQLEEYQVEVYDMLGKVYYRGSFEGGSQPKQAHRIDLSEVKIGEGLYLIRVENKSRSFREVVKVVRNN